MEDLIGRELGRYHIIEQLGRGGMAVVYKAYDTRLNRNVAAKVILPALEQSEEFFTRFEREARALAQLNHPNIVKVHDFGEQDGMPYLVMEYLPGGSLRTKMGKPMPYQEAARIVLPIARALSYAHQRKIIHRDIKPANILISESGEPMLTDFGIAKMLETQETQGLTGTGVGIGTPEYMAPEQGMGQAVDERTDIYALGVVFYELITGRKPFQADTPMAIMVKHMTDPLPRPRKYVADLPEEVERIIFTADAKKPENRYRNMEAFASDLERLIHQAQTMPEVKQSTEKAGETLPGTKTDAAHAATLVEPRVDGDASTVIDQSGLKDEGYTVTEQAMEQAAGRKKISSWVFIVVGGVVVIGILCLLLGGGILGANLIGKLAGNETPTTPVEEIIQPTEALAIEFTPVVEDAPLGDLSSVRINLEDLPDNFIAMSQGDLDQFGLSEEELAESITADLAEATVHNMTAYMSEDFETFQIIVSMLIYPLTSLEKVSFDMVMLDQNAFVNLFSSDMDPSNSGNEIVEVLPGADVVGDKSVGVAFVQAEEGFTLHGEAVMARRDRVITLVYIIFFEGAQPVPAVSIAQILDAKLLSVLP